MKRTLLIARREWRVAFDSPVAYLVLAALPTLTAAFFFLMGDFFARGEASMREFFALMPQLMIPIVPALTMRLWAEEQRSGTEELLLSYPFRVRQLVLGKFLGALGLLALSLAATALVPLTVAWLGPLDWGPVIGGYLATLMLGAACIAVGAWLSSLTHNQIVAWILGVALLLCANLLGAAATARAVPEALGRILLGSDLGLRFQSMARGVIDFGDLAYYLGLVAFFLCLNGLVLERRRWS